MSTVIIAAVQMDIKFAQPEVNLENMADRFEQAVEQDAQLVIFPECATSGYCYEDRESAFEQAQEVEGEATTALSELCAKHDAFVIFGMLEKAGKQLFNSSVLVGPKGLIGSYRKVHLPRLGVDNHVDRGDRPFEIFDVGDLRVGMQICYDCSFPEPSRVMALQGADLIALPTNWPPGAGYTADFVPNCRALENHVYFAAANRVGVESEFQFVGKSKICEPNGGTLASANHDREAILIAEIEPEVARKKHLVRVPGKHEIDRLNDRQPGTYGAITESIHGSESE